MNTSNQKERRILCYKSSHKILLVGEGDFSFSACLARAFRTAENMVATSYLNRELLRQYHRTSIQHLETLENLGAILLHNVDVYTMHTHRVLKNMKFDIIVFNFPHAGHYDYLCESDPELIGMHIELVEAYFKSARLMLNKGGEVHLTQRIDPPYDSWNIVSLARKTGLTLKEERQFIKSDYRGYHNKRGGDFNPNKTFPILCANTYKFVLDSPKVVVDHSDLTSTKGNVVDVLEMNNKVHDDDNGHVNVSEVKDDEQHMKSEFQNGVDDLFVMKNDQDHLVKNFLQKWCCLPWLDLKS